MGRSVSLRYLDHVGEEIPCEHPRQRANVEYPPIPRGGDLPDDGAIEVAHLSLVDRVSHVDRFCGGTERSGKGTEPLRR